MAYKQRKHNFNDSEFDGAVNQLMWVYLLVCVSLSAAWGLGTQGFSFLWVFIVIGFLFGVWRIKLTNIVRRHLSKEEHRIHRKRALRQSETVEWFNFLLNRWWVFSSQNLEEVIKKRIDERLTVVKPSFLDRLELHSFSFGEQTPSVKYVRVFEYNEGVPRGHKPISCVGINSPPTGLDRMSTYQVVLEADIDTSCEDFKMVYRARVGGAKVGLTFDTAVENLNIKGNLQIILQMSMDVPFPHVTKATVSFTELPEVWFSVRVMKALQIMEVPLIKSWLHANVMEGLSKALVDPGKIDIPLTSAGPIQMMQSSKQPQRLAQGVLTIRIKGLPIKDSDPEELRYAMLKVADKKRQTYDVLPTDEWEDICSFFVYSLSKDKIVVKSKRRRLLCNVTMDFHEIELASLPLEMEKTVNTSITNKDSSVFELKLYYTPLTYLDIDVTVDDPPPRQGTEVAGVMYVCVHSATNVLAGDNTGTSDPYCVVFCDRRRVMTTPYIPRTRDPRWERYVEFFVGDVAKANLSFYVFDWDGSNTIDDDFLGSAHLTLKEEESGVVKKNLTLGYNKRSEGYVTDQSFGLITVSVLFRPVPSVAKSEKYRPHSSSGHQDYLYKEDLVSPASVPMAPRPTHHFSTQEESLGGGPGDPAGRLTSASSTEFPQDKLFVDLTLLQARDLMGMDRNGLSDPYCEVQIGNKKLYKTAVKKNTLFPKWNETTTFDVEDDTVKLEINVYDKDVFSKDFLGKVTLTVEKLKEISHKGSSEWLKLQRTKSGQIQIKCVVTSKETISKPKLNRQASNKSRTDSDVFVSSSPSSEKHQLTPPVITEESQKEITPIHTSQLESQPTTPKKREDSPPDVQSSTLPRQRGRRRSQEYYGNPSLKRSVSDINVKKANGQSSNINTPGLTGNMRQSESTNSFTALQQGLDNVSIDKRRTSKKTGDSSVLGVEKLYSVSGRVMRVRGLKLPDNAQIYCKVRIEPQGHRLRLMTSSRVIAKSSLVKVSNSVLNTPFEIDRGAGVNVDTNLILDLKEGHKEHVAQRSFTLGSLFTDCEENGDVQQWLPLSNGVEIELYLTRGKPNPRLVNRQNKANIFKTRSFRKI